MLPVAQRTARYLWILCLVFIAGCASITRDPLPAEIHTQASVLGRLDLRFWGDDAPAIWKEGPVPIDWGGADTDDLAKRYPALVNTEHHYLAISGGGDKGAYGAGILVGWSALGTRPEFNIVTGISTGALTAPFAFLGPEYDDELKQIYTTMSTSSILELRSPFAVFYRDGMADVTPLKNNLENT